MNGRPSPTVGGLRKLISQEVVVMPYTTIVLVVNAEDAERTRRAATGTGATLFSTDVPGVSVDALAAGADPNTWDLDTRG